MALASRPTKTAVTNSWKLQASKRNHNNRVSRPPRYRKTRPTEREEITPREQCIPSLLPPLTNARARTDAHPSEVTSGSGRERVGKNSSSTPKPALSWVLRRRRGLGCRCGLHRGGPGLSLPPVPLSGFCIRVREDVTMLHEEIVHTYVHTYIRGWGCCVYIHI